MEAKQTVDIYVTPALFARFCLVECFLRNACNIKKYEEASPLFPDQSLRVVGGMPVDDCPITNRKYSKANWSATGWGCERTNPNQGS